MSSMLHFPSLALVSLRSAFSGPGLKCNGSFVGHTTTTRQHLPFVTDQQLYVARVNTRGEKTVQRLVFDV